MAFKHNHTKGEWWKSRTNEILSMPGQCKISNNISGSSREEAEANAKLISQAPALLEFAEMLHDQWVKQEKKPMFFEQLRKIIINAGVEITH